MPKKDKTRKILLLGSAAKRVFLICLAFLVVAAKNVSSWVEFFYKPFALIRWNNFDAVACRQTIVCPRQRLNSLSFDIAKPYNVVLAKHVEGIQGGRKH